jgi:hypothetical protein
MSFFNAPMATSPPLVVPGRKKRDSRAVAETGGMKAAGRRAKNPLPIAAVKFIQRSKFIQVH